MTTTNNNTRLAFSAIQKAIVITFGAIGLGTAIFGGEKTTPEKVEAAEQRGEEFKPKKRAFLRGVAAIVGISALTALLGGERTALGRHTHRALNAVGLQSNTVSIP